MRIRSVVTGILALSFSGIVEAKTMCLAHRAEHGKYAENSIEGIREAIAVGADGVEIDLRHTSDGVAIGVHDFILWRVAKSKSGKRCSRFTPISSLKFSEVRENCEMKNSLEIPSLEEMLGVISEMNTFALLQFKDPPSQSTIEILKNFPEKEKLRIHSHWDSALEKFDKLSAERDLHIRVLKINKYWPRLSDKYGNDLWWPFRWVLKIYPELRQREVGLFLVDTKGSLEAAIDLKVDFITTDYPELCRDMPKTK